MTSVNSQRTVLPKQLHRLESPENHLRLQISAFFLLFKTPIDCAIYRLLNAQAFTMPYPDTISIQKISSNKLLKTKVLLPV